MTLVTQNLDTLILRLGAPALLLLWACTIGCVEETPEPTDKSSSALLAKEEPLNPYDPGGHEPIHCTYEQPCWLHCNMTLPRPGTPGACCESGGRSSCLGSGRYDGGRKDPDADGDLILNQDDNCWLTPNPDQKNQDQDLHGDACDNCPLVPNDHQYDANSNGQGDACEDDDDGDGVLNSDDLCPRVPGKWWAWPGGHADLDEDDLGAECDNCPLAYNVDQADQDGDGVGDVCDNCPNLSNASQLDGDGDGRGDACPTTLNETSMRIDTDECSSSDYTQVDHCINRFAPPIPSLHRGISSALPRLDISVSSQDALANMVRLPIDNITTPRGGVVGAGRTQTMPAMRSTNDGRLFFSGGGSTIHIVSHLAQDLHHGDLSGPAGAPVLKEANQGGFSSHILFDTNPGGSNLDLNVVGWGGANFSQLSVCDDSGSAWVPGRGVSEKNNPRVCERLDSAGLQSKGDCYDVTLMVAATGESLSSVNLPSQTIQAGDSRWELRSSDVTIFVGNSKSSTPSVHVYPRTSAGTLLTPSMKDSASDFAPHQAFNTGPIVVTDDCDATCTAPSCIASGKMRKEWWGGMDQALSMFEPVTTADGKVLVANMDEAVGLMYAVASPGNQCQADGFTLFKSLSCFPSDPRTQDYGLAQGAATAPDGRKAFMDSRREFITPGARMGGAYPWIDRDGKNIFFAQVVDFREGWQATHQYPPQSSNRSTFAGSPDQHNSAVGNGIVALGAWTQGKVVVMDNMLNPTDFTGGHNEQWNNTIDDFLPYNFHLALYEGNDWIIRPSTSAQLNSPEHRLHHLDAHSPLMPFDVVWRMATNTNHNAEVAFDEYMFNNAFVVAHMNSPHVLHGQKYYPDDGFTPSNPTESRRGWGNPDFQWRHNPRLQNASSARVSRAPFAQKPPRDLRVRGGARVEPVALGGVRGKGLYLDGVNDFVDMGFQNPEHRDWLFGVWLDWRDLDTRRSRTLFYWADGSWVALSLHELVAYNAGATGAQRLQKIPLSGLSLGDYFHLGVKVYDDAVSGKRQMRVYIDGEERGSMQWANISVGFELSSNQPNEWRWFVLGDPGPALHSPGWTLPRKSFKGWVDEFRVYALSDIDIHSHGVHSPHLDEFICNLALGTLKNQSGQVVCEQLDLGCSLLDPACTPTNPRWHGGPTDFPPQPEMACADRVHRNPGPQAASCQRSQRLALPVLSASAGRPDTTANAFCLGCHMTGHDVPGLELDALESSENMFGVGTTKLNDPRRQPMEGPAAVGGCMPFAPGSALSAMGSSSPCGQSLWPVDLWHDLYGKYVTP